MKMRLFFLIALLSWLSVYVLLISTNAGYTSFKFQSNYKNLVFQLLPQGWGFFTKSPRDANLYVYIKNEKTFKRASRQNFTYKNFYGLSRVDRIKHLQLGRLLSKINDTLWSKFESKDFKSFKNGNEPIEVNNNFRKQLLRGNIFVVSQKPVPWAWSKSSDKFNSPKKILFLHVK